MNLRPKFRLRPSWKPRKQFALKAKPRLKRGSIKQRKGILCEHPKAKGLSIKRISLGKIRETAAAGQRTTKTGRRVNRLPEWTDPRSYITKGKRHRLFGKDYERLRYAAYQRARGDGMTAICECGCGRFAPWGDHMGLAAKGDFAHNEHGSRKSDELRRGKWKRRDCHMNEHNCGGKPITVTKKSLKEKVA